MNKTVLAILPLLLLVACLFEFLPIIKEAQRYVSKENFENFSLSCGELLAARPWYGRVNYWFFIWVAFVPAVLFLVPPTASAWLRGARIVFAVLGCYALMNLAVDLQWDIRNAPFGSGNSYPPGTENGYRMDCVNTADGFSLFFTLVFAWIPASVYVGFCAGFWRFYHRKVSREAAAHDKEDIVTRILFIGLGIYAVLTTIFLAGIAAGAGRAIGWMYYFTLRPLLIPFEIFLY